MTEMSFDVAPHGVRTERARPAYTEAFFSANKAIETHIRASQVNWCYPSTSHAFPSK
jgi:hypothetical protein